MPRGESRAEEPFHPVMACRVDRPRGGAADGEGLHWTASIAAPVAESVTTPSDDRAQSQPRPMTATTSEAARSAEPFTATP